MLEKHRKITPPSQREPEEEEEQKGRFGRWFDRDSDDELAERDPDAPPEPTIISLQEVYKSFGPNEVLKGISMDVEKATSVVVMGGSGSGKSVLLKQIVHLLTPDEGNVFVKGKRLDRLEDDQLDRLRLSTGYLFQGGALFDSMSVYDNLDFLLRRHSERSSRERKQRIEETLAWVNLEDTASQFPAQLSGGQKKRIGLARAIILEPEIMLYDEPTTGLDPISVRTVSDLIVRLRDERGITSISITHDLLCADIIADQAHFLYDGEFVGSGSMEELRRSDHPALREFFGQ